MKRKSFSIATFVALAFALTSCSAGDEFDQLSEPAIDSTSIAFQMQRSGAVVEEEDSTQIQIDINISDFKEENMDKNL